MKKTMAILLVIILTFSIAACGGGEPNEGTTPTSSAPTSSAPTTGTTAPSTPPAPTAPPSVGATLKEHLEIMSNNFIPAVINAFNPSGTTAPCQWIYLLITDPLILWNEVTGLPEPLAAKSWETADNQTFRFFLQEDAFFHTGEKMTAEDVKFTIEISREFGGTAAFDRWRAVTEVNIIDQYTVDIVLERQNAGFLPNLSMPSAGIYSKKAYEERPDDWFWIGTGPFMLTDFSTNEYVTLERYDNYWGGPAPTKSMTFRFVPEETVRTVMMLNGDFDFSLGIQANDFELFRNDPNFIVVDRLLISPLSVGFNMTDPICGDYNFRMAVCYALDGYDIGVVAEGVDGTLRMTDSNVWGADTGYRRTDFPRYERDLDKAKEYLEMSVWNGETIEITAGAPPFIRGAEMIQEQLLQIGIPTIINQTDQPGLFAHVAFGNNKSQLHFFCPEMTFDPFVVVRNNFVPSPTNRSSFTHPRIEELLLEAEASTDTAVHEANFHEIQQIVFDNMPWYPVIWRLFGDVGVAGLGGMVQSTTSTRQNFRGLYVQLDG